MARHTYPDMLKTLANAQAIHQAEILESGYGYSDWVRNFRLIIKALSIDETSILDDIARIVKNHPMDNYLEPVVKLLIDKSKSGVDEEFLRIALLPRG